VPEGLGLAGTYGKTEDLTLTGHLDAQRDHQSFAYDAVIVPYLQICRIQPYIWVRPLKRPAQKQVDLLIQLSGDPRDFALVDTVQAQRSYEVIHLARADTVNIRLLNYRQDGFLRHLPRFQEAGEE